MWWCRGTSKATIQVLRRRNVRSRNLAPHPASPRKRYGATEPWAGRGDSRWITWKLHRSRNASPSPRRGYGLAHVFFGERLGEGAAANVGSAHRPPRWRISPLHLADFRGLLNSHHGCSFSSQPNSEVRPTSSPHQYHASSEPVSPPSPCAAGSAQYPRRSTPGS
jgi:hypothetical protein